MDAKKPLIMVVDDDFDALEILRQMLEAGGFHVLVFSDPTDALEHMRTITPDLIISDLMMKFIDSGFSFSRLVSSDPRFRHVPIILVTSAVKKRGFMIQLQEKGGLAKMGISAYFDKPVDPGKLLATVRELLARPKE